jgi:hypothetical protein
MRLTNILQRLWRGRDGSTASVQIQRLEDRSLFSSAYSIIPDPNTPIGPVYVAPLEHSPKQAMATTVLAAPKVSAGYYDGISVNSSDDASKIIPKLRALGVKGVRLWMGMTTWNHRDNGWAFRESVKYKAAGFKVMMNVNCVNTASESTYRSFFNWLKKQPGFYSASMIQVGNEPNHYKSWHGGIDGYMKLLKVAWSELHPAGMKVLGAGVTWDINACKELKSKGYLNYVDYAAFHPYANSPQGVINLLRQGRAVYDSKPLILSEWNVRGQSGGSQWANALKEIRKDLAKYCDGAYYFTLVKTNTMAGPSGAYTKSWAPNGPYFDAIKSFQYMEGGSKR